MVTLATLGRQRLVFNTRERMVWGTECVHNRIYTLTQQRETKERGRERGLIIVE